MKKILTILALMIATVAVVATGYTLTRPAKAAGDVSNFNGKVSWKGTVTGKGSNTTDVTVTDKGGGLYDINIKALTVYGRDSEITFTNVPGTAQGEGVVFSTNGQNSTYTVNSAWGDQIAMTVEGKMLGDQLYLFCSGKVFGWSDDPFTITYGEDFEIPAGPVGPSHKFTGKVSYNGNWTGKGNNETDVVIAENGDGLYTINIKTLSVYDDNGNIKFTNVPGTAQGEGVVFSTNGEKLTGTVEGSNYGNTAVMTVEGKMLGEQLYLVCSGKYVGFGDDPFVITYGEDFEMPAAPEAEPTASYTDKAVTTFMGTNEQTFENAKVDVYETGENKYKFVIKQYQFASYLLGDFTAVDVAGTPNADGSVSYSFNGKATASNIGPSATAFGVGEGKEFELKFEGKSKDGKIYINGAFNISGYQCTYTFGTEIKDPEPEPEVVPGTKVGEDNYAPNGVKFTWNTPIDWNTQKLVAAIDLSGCKGGTEDENILSVGSNIGEWEAAPHLHLYYTSGTKNLNFNFMAQGSESGVGNRSRYDVTLTDDILVIELSKEKGLVINGTQYLNKYNTSDQYADIDAYLAATSDFWALTNIDLGCQQGNPSYATYKYIRVQNLESTPEPAKPVVYTDNAKATFNGSTVDLTDQTVEITATGENRYTVVYKNLTVGNTQIGDFTAENVEGVEDAEGNINYTFEGEATMSNINTIYGGMFSEGQKVAFAMTGSSKDNKLVAKFTATVLGQEAKILYGGYEEGGETPDVPGIKVGEDGYQPAGEKFAWNTAIDWNTQKLVASINVAGCTGENEGILSVGDAIDAWNGTHFHLYYTRSNNTLQVNYLDATGNPIRKEVEVAGDELLIEISKAAGITVNGNSVNYLNESGELTENYTVYNALWALTEISVGSQEGNGRSNATYNYVRIQEVPVTVTESESFTDDLTVTEPSTKTKTTEGKKLDINTYSDETYGLTIYNVEGETANLGDITIKGLNVTEEEGIKYYNADAKATVNGEEMSVNVAGVKYADGKVWFQFELLTANEDLYFIEFGHKQEEGREFGEGKAYKGQWAISQPSATFDGTVDVILQEDGKYALRVHNFQLDGNVVPTFVIPDLVGSEEEGKLYISQMSNVPVYYEATDGDDAAVVADEKKVTYVEYITVTSESADDLSINISYVGYGDGSNDYVTNANFATLTNGINSINAAAQNGKADIYSINGAKVNAMQKGINIVRMNNKTVKIVKK